MSRKLAESKSSSGSARIWLIVVILGLIGLVIVAIVFRDRLRPYWFKAKSKFNDLLGKFGKKSGKFPPAPGMPRGRLPSRGRPGLRRAPVGRRPAPKRKQARGEIDDVLDKLKEMGK